MNSAINFMTAQSQDTPVERQAIKNVTCLDNTFLRTQTYEEEIIQNQVKKKNHFSIISTNLFILS